ncbi:Hypothetical protein OINT_2001021 [Brucella intermedia LMG 3301]|uniref:Uncharacterized protein n=1 Tax=Brucella intermedia LMG 3301 TaxID=641118 RepID=C4WN80_9HYPH|nr:Hypothetical protein OINT_2001021 [Brucella intermedia LMG 3301]ERI13478.1 hypothetical protein O206_08395 [Ochrobactrum sp. EGD-AQ16]
MTVFRVAGRFLPSSSHDFDMSPDMPVRLSRGIFSAA